MCPDKKFSSYLTTSLFFVIDGSMEKFQVIQSVFFNWCKLFQKYVFFNMVNSKLTRSFNSLQHSTDTRLKRVFILS